MELKLRADAEILPEPFPIHAGPVVSDLYAVFRYRDFDKGRIGIIGIVYDFADKLDALGVKPLAYRNDMALIDSDRYEFFSRVHERIILAQWAVGKKNSEYNPPHCPSHEGTIFSVHLVDCYFAITAAENNCSIFTLDEHFQDIKRFIAITLL